MVSIGQHFAERRIGARWVFDAEAKLGVVEVYAEAVIAEFTREGINDEALAADLQREGVNAFAQSWRDLMYRIASKSTVLTNDSPA